MTDIKPLLLLALAVVIPTSATAHPTVAEPAPGLAASSVELQRQDYQRIQKRTKLTVALKALESVGVLTFELTRLEASAGLPATAELAPVGAAEGN